MTIKQETTLKAKYRRAQDLMQGYWSRTIVANSTLYPIWIEGSDCFWYERELTTDHNIKNLDEPLIKWDKEYRLVNAKAATNSIAFDHAALAAALSEQNPDESSIDKNRMPISKVQMTLDSDQKLKALDFVAFGKSWLFEAATGALNEVPAPIATRERLLSPDGQWLMFTRDYNLWLQNVITGEERALTQDGEEEYCYAVAGNGWGYTMGSFLQARWSPDSKRIFTLQRDSRQVLPVAIVEHVPKDGSIRPKVRQAKIAYQGDDHVPDFRMVAIDIDSGRLQAADYPKVPVTRNSWGFFDANFGCWGADSQHAYFVDLARGYQKVRVVEFDTHTGNTRVILEETSDTFIGLMQNDDDRPTFTFLPESNELVWYSERSGWAHLYLYDLSSGELKNAITSGEWVVRELLSFDLERRELLIQTMGRDANKDPYYRDLVRVHMDSGALTPLATADYDFGAISALQHDLPTYQARLVGGRDILAARSVSHSNNYTVVTRSRADTVPVSLLLDREGNDILTLEEGDLSALHARVSNNWQWPEPVKMLSADGKTDIYGLIYRPSDFSPDQSYPVVSEAFNTPELPWVPKGSFSNNLFNGKGYLEPAALAELGFIVVQIDGRGTPFRGKAFHDECYGWAESASHLDDHVAGIKQLAERYTYMDLDRVGFFNLMGGTGAAQGLLRYPEFYKVGTVGMLHDSRIVAASMWTDKYEGLSGPDKTQQYLEAYADQLEGKLLIVSGMLDTSTLPAASFRFIEALQKANKNFDMLMLPNVGHEGSGYLTRRAWDYLVKYLLGETPPNDFALTNCEEIWHAD